MNKIIVFHNISPERRMPEQQRRLGHCKDVSRGKKLTSIVAPKALDGDDIDPPGLPQSVEPSVDGYGYFPPSVGHR